jgi:cytochrome c oxidase cbb3-type subunit 2
MPSYPYMFELKDQVSEGDVVVRLPESLQPAGKHVVARKEALDLVEYLLALDRTYATSAQELDKRDRGYDRRPAEASTDSGAK